MKQEKLKNLRTEILSNNWSTLKKVTYDWLNADGSIETQVRECYELGNGATVLLYNPEKKKIILTLQFRVPTYMNKNPSGMMIEACAGRVDPGENPEESMIREIEEETGYKVSLVKKIFDLYMSPGSVNEILYFYTAVYNESMKVSDGGGKASEQENIEVLEISYDEALSWVKEGKIKDAKTLILLQHGVLNGILN